VFYTVYKVTNQLNGRYYVGIHATQDLNDSYLGSGTAITRAIKKYGRENFRKETLHIFDNEQSMVDKEIEIVTEDFIRLEETYNLRVGGIYWAGEAHTDERKKKISAANVKAWAEGRMDHIVPRIRKAMQKRAAEGKQNTFLGRKHSDASLAKMSEAASLRVGDQNASFGSKWLHNVELRASRKVKEPELSALLACGWQLGRVVNWDSPKKEEAVNDDGVRVRRAKQPKPVSERNFRRKVSDADLLHALNTQPSIAQALIAVGIQPRGKNYTRAKRLLGYADDVRLNTNGKPKPT